MVFPTGVGMNRNSYQALCYVFCVPHRRGDEPPPTNTKG